MKLITGSDIVAALLASFVCSPVFLASQYIFTWDPSNNLFEDFIKSTAYFIAGSIALQIYTYPITLAIVLFIGVPLHIFMRLCGIQRYRFIGLMGGPIVAVYTLRQLYYENVEVAWLLICCGACVSATYAYLSKKFNTSR